MVTQQRSSSFLVFSQNLEVLEISLTLIEVSHYFHKNSIKFPPKNWCHKKKKIPNDNVDLRDFPYTEE